ncbi:hybrid sensor histidine kinase/response regulator [Paragemmobacter ruber]|uniref:histidine kinase n=1 Tax=Paragemmobacter ruber TaxID=1985673 RepID=A0ABW9Y5Z5_9RHOB|nr:ATP-binding protein [Rhodobacter ruber]NBE07833.1 response regulator [Rhodobacter ruber]
MPQHVWAGRLRLGVALALALACLVIIGLLAHEVRAKLAALQRASSDNAQWVMMQTEVEVLRLQAAVHLARENPTSPALDEVRRWFNIVYSRISMLEQSAIYAPLMTQPAYQADHARLRGFVDSRVATIDGPDTRLATELAAMERDLPEIRGIARQMTLNALADFSAQSDQNRASISVILLRLAFVSFVLLLIVAGVAAVLALQIRRSEAQKRALADTGAWLSTIVDTSADGIVATDLDGVIRAFNPAAEAIFGLSASAVQGKNALDALLVEDASGGPQRDALRAALRNPDPAAAPLRIEVDARHGTRGSFPAEVSIARSRIAEAGLIVAFVRDISDRRAADAALTRARDSARAGERAKAEFLAVMSHEMRTPLTGLMGSMELLRRSIDNPDQQELLSVMETSGQILLDHVNSVLDVSRAEAGSIAVDRSTFDLDRLLDDVVANQAGLAAAAGNHLTHASLTGRFGLVTGDRGRLQQILLNLIGNAVKFTHGGEIRIEAERLGGTRDLVEIRVTDTGIGIPETDQDRIFDDFVTLDASYGRSAGGTGLGLGIARRLARAMDGTIGVESVEGEGSLFWLRLPLPAAGAEKLLPGPVQRPPTATAPAPVPTQAPPAAPFAGSRAEPGMGPPQSVLLVEDNAINRFLLRRFLESGGHRVTEACDGVDGVERATEMRFDVILMDISMPRLDGVAATETIRSGNGPSAQSRILALTAHALPQELARFRAAGMEATLTKPITRTALLAAVAGTLPDTAPPAAPLNGDTAIMDDESLADLGTQLGPATAHRLIARLIDEADAIVAQLSRLDPAADAGQIAKLCHTLAGSSGTFGTRGLRVALQSVQTALKLQLDGQGADAETPERRAALRAVLAAIPPAWAACRARLVAEQGRLATAIPDTPPQVVSAR